MGRKKIKRVLLVSRLLCFPAGNELLCNLIDSNYKNSKHIHSITPHLEALPDTGVCHVPEMGPANWP